MKKPKLKCKFSWPVVPKKESKLIDELLKFGWTYQTNVMIELPSGVLNKNFQVGKGKK